MAANLVTHSGLEFNDSDNLPMHHLRACKITSCVTRYEDEVKQKKKYTAFVIEITTRGHQAWNVERRYREFYALNKILKGRYAELKLFKFPQKKWFSSFATSTVENRRRDFEQYLQELLSLQPRPSELNSFLQINSNVWGVSGGQGASSLNGTSATASEQQKRTQEESLARLQRGEVGIDDFELVKVLGKGSFGKVFMVRLIPTGKVYAMKVLKKSEVARRRQVEHTKAERRIMGGLDHPFIVSLRFAFQTQDKLYMVTDYCRGGELFFHLKNLRCFTEDMARFFAAELVVALQHLHACDIVYRDLKPENVLLDEDGHIRLTDFGLSKDSVSDPRGATTFCGTPEYLAPEMLINRKSREGYGKAVDWWSLGTLIFEMLTGWPPFYSKNLRTMCSKILNSKLVFPHGCTVSTEVRELIGGLLERDPLERLGNDVQEITLGDGEKRVMDGMDIRAHPFFAGVDWKAVENREIQPPYRPQTSAEDDYSNFDVTFTAEQAVLTPPEPSVLSVNEDDFNDFQYADQKHVFQSTSSGGAGEESNTEETTSNVQSKNDNDHKDSDTSNLSDKIASVEINEDKNENDRTTEEPEVTAVSS